MSFMKVLKSRKGFTLIEIVASVALLGVITVAFFSIFSSGYSNVNTSGDKAAALANASQKMELLYGLDNIGTLNQSTLDTLFSPEQSVFTTDYSQLFTYPTGGQNIRVYIQPSNPLPGEVSGFKTYVAVFYSNGKQYVSLNTFIKAKGVT